MAGKQNFTVRQNVPFRKRMRYMSKAKRPIVLTGYRAKLQTRSVPGDAVVLMELTTENGGVALDANGYITLSMSLAQVQALNFQTAVYDLVLIPPNNGVPVVLLEGKILVSPGVTQL